MREILFRGKRVIDGEWAESCCPLGEMHSGTVTHDFDPKTVCQYTGFRDVNGKKIFEGDIVGYIDMYSTENGYSEMDCVGEVGWSEEEACFYVTNRLSAESWEVLGECAIIGNIFDNPELLEDRDLVKEEDHEKSN